MIIRMTVEDNDFTEMLEDFADNLFERLYIESSLVLNEFYDPEMLHRLIEIEETIRKTMWAESMDDITDEAKTLLKAKLVIIWCKYVDSTEKEDRIKELAIMLSGETISLYALEHAKSLLEKK